VACDVFVVVLFFEGVISICVSTSQAAGAPRPRSHFSEKVDLMNVSARAQTLAPDGFIVSHNSVDTAEM
jgi:hypothetical protein